jgi:hypothetical protein
MKEEEEMQIWGEKMAKNRTRVKEGEKRDNEVKMDEEMKRRKLRKRKKKENQNERKMRNNEEKEIETQEKEKTYGNKVRVPLRSPYNYEEVRGP